MSSIIIALDPGVTTGVCVYANGNITKAFTIQADHEALYEFLFSYQPDTVVYERFDYRPHQPVADLYPVELIGIIKLYCQRNGVDSVPQKQLKGHRGFWTDDKLKALDLYKVGEQGHSNDATRQMLYYLTFTVGDQSFVQKLSAL